MRKLKQEIKERIDMINRGEIPEGYKKTKVGIIPVDWEVKKLKDISNINSKSLDNSVDKNCMFYYYDLSCVDNGNIKHPNEKISFNSLPSRARRIFNTNDILMSTVRPYLKGFAKASFETSDCICSTGFAVISSKNINDIDLIYQNLFSYEIEKQINSLLVGSNYPAINNKDVQNLKIPYSTKQYERKAIGKILSTWDNAMALKEKLLEQKKQQKKGLMQNLLTGKVRLPGFDGEWKKVELGDIVECYNSKSLEKYFNQETGLKVISIGNYSVDGTYIDKGILVELNEETKKYVLNKNDLAMVLNDKTKEGRIIGRVLLIDEDNKYIFNQRTARLVVNNELVLSKYLYYLINSDEFHRKIFSISQGGTQIYINIKPLLRLNTRIPGLLEQESISNFLDAMSKEIKLLEKELEALKEQKKGLMQLLLTGKVRVKV
ncbi:restriction endonuclease subunit S [Tepidibacter formicigenes]|uniref:restriction endonuclease subunit S n=1 Tax=Tepidibacter formicigenes TaxID=227138 RepID=UPI00093306B3|nr:restriction endonuclease subunit S [Tepidibacter formicigenes]